MDIGEGELNRLGVIRALPNACGANMLCRAVSSISRFNNARSLRFLENQIFLDFTYELQNDGSQHSGSLFRSSLDMFQLPV